MERLKIIVCTHNKSIKMHEDCFLPIQVGKAISDLDLGIQGDDQGDNISYKNPNYCELTGHYWLWKNVKDVDYVGLCHYRRFFNFDTAGDCFVDYSLVRESDFDFLNTKRPDVSKLFKRHDIVLAKPKVYPFSLSVDYSVCHQSKDFKILEQVILEQDPSYKTSVDHIFHGNNKLSHYNMFVMKSKDFEKYSQWMFAILEEVERRIDISDYDRAQSRIFGYQSERMLNLYVYHNKMRVNYRPIYYVNNTLVHQSFLRRVLRHIRNVISFNINRSFSKK